MCKSSPGGYCRPKESNNACPGTKSGIYMNKSSRTVVIGRQASSGPSPCTLPGRLLPLNPATSYTPKYSIYSIPCWSKSLPFLPSIWTSLLFLCHCPKCLHRVYQCVSTSSFSSYVKYGIPRQDGVLLQ